MRSLQSWLAGLVVPAVLFGLLLPAAAAEKKAEKKAVKLEKEWQGSVEDADLAKDAPAVITNGKALEKLWKAWKVEGKVPEVDFDKQIVVVQTTSGSKLRVSASLDDKGDLKVLGLGTRDLVPGFRYVIATVSREGVKTINGKDLPKE
jgi:hypothetical protein